MKVQKVTKAQGEYAKKGIDFIAGDTLKVASEGEWITGEFGEQFVVKVETKNGAKNVRFNQTTINILHDEFGEDTSNWIGKEVLVRMKKDTVAGKKVDIYYFVTPNWDFDEYRELVDTGEVMAKQAEEGMPQSDEDDVNDKLMAAKPPKEDLPF